MDKAWKQFERTVATFFGTTRALHGMSRTVGEVDTDVFVHVPTWFEYMKRSLPALETSYPTALVVECKHSRKDDHPNRKILAELQEIYLEHRARPLLISPDRWCWIQLRDFPDFYLQFAHPTPLLPLDLVQRYEVHHLPRETPKFFKDAIDQARTAVLPNTELFRKDQEKAPTWGRRMHIICTGSNARMPPAVGIPPGPTWIQPLYRAYEAQEEPQNEE